MSCVPRALKLPRLWLFALALALAGLLVNTVGCKTQDDAEAAAQQMAITAQALSSYYEALDRLAARAEDTYRARTALNPMIPPAESLADTRRQLRLRAAMAADIAAMAAVFSKITASTAAADATTAADKLNTELIEVKAFKSNETETMALKFAVRNIVSLYQEHEEVKAAREVAPLCHDLSLFFDSEKPAYDGIAEGYLTAARAVTHSLIGSNQIDVTSVYDSATRAYGLTPAINQESARVGMKAYLESQLDSKYDSEMARATRTSDSIAAALLEMDKRVELVARGRPMQLRFTPISLKQAESWIAETLGK